MLDVDGREIEILCSLCGRARTAEILDQSRGEIAMFCFPCMKKSHDQAMARGFSADQDRIDSRRLWLSRGFLMEPFSVFPAPSTLTLLHQAEQSEKAEMDIDNKTKDDIIEIEEPILEPE
jgi:hypothetical protein